jgi:hypothetical protein
MSLTNKKSKVSVIVSDTKLGKFFKQPNKKEKRKKKKKTKRKEAKEKIKKKK